ncbi:hypothetical protein ILUMI_17163, partial [Ignelater luminosus]
MKVGASHDEKVNSDSNQNIIHERQSLVNGHENKSFLISNASTETLNNNLEVSETKLTMEKQLLSGWQLWRNQFTAMFLKYSLSILRSWLLYVIHNLIAVSFLALTIVVVRNKGFNDELPKLKVDLNAYNDPITVLTRTNVNNVYAKSYIDMLKSNENAYINWENGDMSIKMRNETERNPGGVRVRYITGASFENNDIYAYFNNDPYHSPPLSLQMVFNAILKAEVSTKHSIQMFNHPLPFSAITKVSLIDLATSNFSKCTLSSHHILK